MCKELLKECFDKINCFFQILQCYLLNTSWHSLQVSKCMFYKGFSIQTLTWSESSRFVQVIVLQWPFQTYLQGRMFGLKCWQKAEIALAKFSVWILFSGWCSVQSWPLRKANFPAWCICATRSPGVLWHASHSGRYYPWSWITILKHQWHRFHIGCQGHQWQKQLPHLCTVHSSQLQMALHWLLISFPTASLVHAEKAKSKGAITDKGC